MAVMAGCVRDRPGCEADRSPPASAEVKNTWISIYP
jgi:hypothetical protein